MMKFWYVNHKNENELREVNPIKLEYYDEHDDVVTEYGYEPGWFLRAYDPSRRDERSFALARINTAEIEAPGLVFADTTLDAVKDTTQALAERADTVIKQTSPEISTMAARYVGMDRGVMADLFHRDPACFFDDLVSLAASALSQDETKGQ